MIKWKISLLFIFFFLQFSFVPAFSSVGFNFMLLYAIILFFIFGDNYKDIFFWILAAGFLFDYFSFNFFGAGIVSLLFIFIFNFLFFRNFFVKERSFLEKFMVMILFKIIFDFCYWLYNFLIFYFFNHLENRIFFYQLFNKSYIFQLLLFGLISWGCIFFMNKFMRRGESKLILK